MDKKEQIRDKAKDILSPWTFEFKTDDIDYQEKINYYRFKSHGLAIHPPDGEITDIGIFHFTPGNLKNINDAENKIDSTKMVIRELIEATDHLEHFISEHRDTHLARIKEFYGTTNKNFALFLEKYFKATITELDSLSEGEEPKYLIFISMDQLISKAKEFREKFHFIKKHN